MGFKDQVAADVDNVFFQTDEFAETAIVDGKPVPIVIDNDGLNRKSHLHGCVD